MVDKRKEFPTKFALLFELIICARDCLTCDMINYLKAMKNFLNEFIDNIVFDLQ